MDLKPETAAHRWRRRLLDIYDLEAPEHRHKLAIVDAAADQMRRQLEARATINREGATVEDRFGQVRPHPAALQERQAAMAFSKLVRDLRLEEDD